MTRLAGNKQPAAEEEHLRRDASVRKIFSEIQALSEGTNWNENMVLNQDPLEA